MVARRESSQFAVRKPSGGNRLVLLVLREVADSA
jgi:hypothetical protein